MAPTVSMKRTWKFCFEAFARPLRHPLHILERSLIYPWAAWRGWRPPPLGSVALRELDFDYGYDDEARLKKAVRLVALHTYVSLEGLASLWWQIRQLDTQDVPGALVECGVRQGGASAMMAAAHLAWSVVPRRELHLFDSFSTWPEPTERDGQWGKDINALWRAIERNPTYLGYPAADSRELIVERVGYPEHLLRYHVGWFQETVWSAASCLGPIALLRLDGDWYESTKVCLEALYPNVSRGGIVVIDDYGAFEGCRKAVDEFTATLPRPFFLHRIDFTGRYWIKHGV